MTKTPTSPQDAPTTSPQIRARLAQALNLDLIGPWPQHELAEESSEERWPKRDEGWNAPSTRPSTAPCTLRRVRRGNARGRQHDPTG